MAEHRKYRSDEELGEALYLAGQHLSFPRTPDIAPAVRERILSGSRPVRRSPWRPRRLAGIAAAFAVLIVAAVFASPGTRTTVAEWFDIPGVRFFAETPEERPALGGPLHLGDPVTLDEARDRVTFPVLVPDLPWLEGPDEVYLDTEPVGGAVSFVYHATERLPEAEETGVGLLLSQFQGQLNSGMYGKGLPEGVELEVFEINGETAFWISGEPHTFSYFDPSDEYVQETLRLAGNTLLWQQGGLTLRLESVLDLDSALAIASSMR